MHLMPYSPFMADPCQLLFRLRPVIRHGLKELTFASPRHALTEVALIAYLMGMGFDFRFALHAVESMEVDEMLPCED